MSAGHSHEEHAHRPVWQYLVVAAVLGVITFVELGPLFEWFNIPTAGLMVLSLLKFILVAAIFMHLADEHKFFTQVFAIPLVAAGVMIVVLMLLFSSFLPSLRQGAREDSYPVAERHWANYDGECSSWVRSHISNKLYCASPPISRDRVAMYNKADGDGGGAKVEIKLAAGMSEEETAQALVAAGEGLYTQHCAACHQGNGAGVAGVFPPLAGSDYIDDGDKHVNIIIGGLNGEIVVNGTTYNGVMQPFGNLTDDEIAAIATYERKSWGNDLSVVTPAQVAALR